MGRKKLVYEDYITEEIKEMIPKYKRQAQTDEWIWKKIGISKRVGIRWKTEYSEFRELFKKGNDDLDIELEESMYARGQGFIKILREYKLDKNGEIIPDSIKIKEKFVWSDQCLLMALRKRMPEKWGGLEEGNTGIDIKDTTINVSIKPVKKKRGEDDDES